MCGRGTFLVEAATLWPSARYLGVDLSEEQLKDAKENYLAAHVPMELTKADARNLSHLGDGSVDKILTCPPFGRQFEKISANLYKELLVEWSRVLKESGLMVILVDVSNVQALCDAVDEAQCAIEFRRSPFRLGKIRATLVVVVKGSQSRPTREGKFDWEQGDQKGRSLWAEIRERALPSLVPYSLSRTITDAKL